MSAPRRPLILLLLVCFAVVGLSSPGSSALQSSSLSISPNVYVGGQMLTYDGNVGRGGVVVTLQGSQRPGAPWAKIARTRSEPDGRYSFTLPAPSMRGIMRRVVADGESSNVLRMYAQSQDVVLAPVGTPVVGDRFQITASTVPGPHFVRDHPFYVKGRPDLPGPVFTGRELTLQRNGPDGSWLDVPDARATVDLAGTGTFDVTADEAGTIVYRVVQEDYAQAGGPPIGWFPSFPTPIKIARNRAEAITYDPPAPLLTQAPAAAPALSEDGSMLAARMTETTQGSNAITAQAAKGWGGALWDFGLPLGESLTSPPSRGSKRVGQWLDGSNGTGRANQHNGGVSLNSQRYAPDPGASENQGDRGSTWITLQDNPRKYGRWEARVRIRPYERGARDYRNTVELIPESEGQRCAGRTITVADLAAHSPNMRFGVNSTKAHRTWQRTRRIGDIANEPITVAVEVTKRHITWFYNGKPVGTVRTGAAVPRVPLTMRITMEGDGDREMNRTMTHMDWMRGFSLNRGTKTKNGGKMSVRRFGGSC